MHCKVYVPACILHRPVASDDGPWGLIQNNAATAAHRHLSAARASHPPSADLTRQAAAQPARPGKGAGAPAHAARRGKPAIIIQPNCPLQLNNPAGCQPNLT